MVLREDRPYQLQDVDGTPLNKEQAHKIIAERYTVPDEVRGRNSKRTHHEQVERQAEKNQKRKSRTS